MPTARLKKYGLENALSVLGCEGLGVLTGDVVGDGALYFTDLSVVGRDGNSSLFDGDGRLSRNISGCVFRISSTIAIVSGLNDLSRFRGSGCNFMLSDIFRLQCFFEPANEGFYAVPRVVYVVDVVQVL